MSIYSTATLGQSDNRITFNDFTTNPVYRTISRAPRQFQVRDDNIPIPFESGVSDFKTLIGQTLYVIQGKMYPQDETSYDNGIAALRKACYLDFNNDDTTDFFDDGYVPYTWGEVSGGSKTLFVKPLYVQMAENTQQGFVQPFVIFCKVKDPIVYGATLQLASTATSNPSASTGSATYPFKYPILYGATLFTVSANANNIGNIPAYPFSINVYGPVTNPKVTNGFNGQFIQVNVTLNSVSDNLYIQYDKDSLVVTVNGVSVVNKVTADSTYFKIQPGVNIMTLSGSSVGVGSYAVVGFRNSYPLP